MKIKHTYFSGNACQSPLKTDHLKDRRYLRICNWLTITFGSEEIPRRIPAFSNILACAKHHLFLACCLAPLFCLCFWKLCLFLFQAFPGKGYCWWACCGWTIHGVTQQMLALFFVIQIHFCSSWRLGAAVTDHVPHFLLMLAFSVQLLAALAGAPRMAWW